MAKNKIKALLNPSAEQKLTIQRNGITLNLAAVDYDRGEGKRYMGIKSDVEIDMLQSYLAKIQLADLPANTSAEDKIKHANDEQLLMQQWDNRLRSMFNLTLFKSAYRAAVANIPADSKNPDWTLIQKEIEAYIDTEARGESGAGREKTSVFYMKEETRLMLELKALKIKLGGDKSNVYKTEPSFLAKRTEVLAMQATRKAKEQQEREAKEKAAMGL